MNEASKPDRPSNVFVADESVFICEVTVPDLLSKRSASKTQGGVTARLADGSESNRVGCLDFFMKDGVLATIRYWTHVEHRRQGCAREMTKALRREYPGIRLVTSPARPTSEGYGTLVRLHEDGLIDELFVDLSAGVEEAEIGE